MSNIQKLLDDNFPFPVEIDFEDPHWWLDHDQKKICDALLADPDYNKVNAYRSVRKTRSTNVVYKFFDQPKVKRYLYVRSKALAEETHLTQERVIKELLNVVEVAMGRKATPMVLGHSEGVPVVTKAKNTDLAAANKALATLGKFYKLGMWTEKQDKEVKNVTFNFNFGQPEKKGDTYDAE